MKKEIKLSKQQKILFKKVDVVFSELNKKLPKFSDFFTEAIITGNAESINLKKLYPDLYKKTEDLIKQVNKNAAKK